jgi:hypothetical protein
MIAPEELAEAHVGDVHDEHDVSGMEIRGQIVHVGSLVGVSKTSVFDRRKR